MVGRHPAMLDVYRRVWDTVESDLAPLLSGETGTGKELVARAYHRLRHGEQKPFFALNCGALPEHLTESELFGAERGAFTGAVRRVVGLFEQAQGTTIFLDELDSLAPWHQPKLLRVLEERRVRRLGGRGSFEVAFDLISAVSGPPAQLVADGLLREDLFHRVNEIPVELPPLRVRRSDIPLLVRAFLDGAPGADRQRQDLTAEAMELLEQQPWYGNVRELRHLVRRVSRLVTGPLIQYEHVLSELRPHPVPPSRPDSRPDPGLGYTSSKARGPAPAQRQPASWGEAGSAPAAGGDGSPERTQRVLRGNRAGLAALVARSGGYVAEAARTAGVARTTLRRWLREVGLASSRERGRPGRIPVAVIDRSHL
jgi:DNA-binding NtrC family response regulator